MAIPRNVCIYSFDCGSTNMGACIVSAIESTKFARTPSGRISNTKPMVKTYQIYSIDDIDLRSLCIEKWSATSLATAVISYIHQVVVSRPDIVIIEQQY